MVVIPGPVEFVMGSPPTEAGRQDHEIEHKARITRTFALAAKPVTVEQFGLFENGDLPSSVSTGTAELPAVRISWFMAAKYCNWLSKEDGIPEARVVLRVERRQGRFEAALLEPERLSAADRIRDGVCNSCRRRNQRLFWRDRRTAAQVCLV